MTILRKINVWHIVTALVLLILVLVSVRPEWIVGGIK